MEKGPYTKFCGVLISFNEFLKLKAFEYDVSDVIHANVKTFLNRFSEHVFVNFMDKEPSAKFYGVLAHFSRTQKVPKFRITKLCLNVRDVIRANEHT